MKVNKGIVTTIMISILLFIGCSNYIYKINEKFSVRYFESCSCNSITMTTEAGGNGNVPFLKNVQEVKGNEELFFVKTSSKHSTNEIWVVIESDIVNQKEDYREIKQIELEKILDTLKIDIHKIFN